MINDERLVDSLDDWRHNADPEVVAWLEKAVKAARHFKEPSERIASWEALLELARAAQ